MSTSFILQVEALLQEFCDARIGPNALSPAWAWNCPDVFFRQRFLASRWLQRSMPTTKYVPFIFDNSAGFDRRQTKLQWPVWLNSGILSWLKAQQKTLPDSVTPTFMATSLFIIYGAVTTNHGTNLSMDCKYEPYGAFPNIPTMVLGRQQMQDIISTREKGLCRQLECQQIRNKNHTDETRHWTQPP